MRRVRFLLLAALIIVSALFAGTKYLQHFSGRDVPPEIECPQDILDISVLQDEAVLLSGVTASDAQDGDLTQEIMVAGISKLISDNTAKVTYMVFDSDDNMAMCERTIRYLDYHRPEIEVRSALNFSRDETMGIISRLRVEDVVDGDISDKIRISTLRVTDDSNIYTVVAQVTNSLGDSARQELYVTLMDTDPDRPVIYLSEYLTRISQGDAFEPRDYIRSVSVSRKGVSTSDVYYETNVDTAVPGTYWVKYYYSAQGNTGMVIMTVVVEPTGGAENE